MATSDATLLDGDRVLSAGRKPALVDLLLRLFKRKPLGAVSLVVIVVLVALAFIGPMVAPFDPAAPDFPRLQPPNSVNYFGTDGFGRDLFTRVLYGARISLLVGFGALIIQITVATFIGMTSGYFGGVYSSLIQRLVDAVQSFPALVLLITVTSVVGSGISQMTITLGLLGSAGASRIVRSAVLGVLSAGYVESAKAVGASNTRIMLRHVLPNIFAPLMVTSTIALGGFILAEASLSFLGLGINDPGTPSWGQTLNNARRFVTTQPLQAFWPGLAISLAVYSFNMLGDTLRDLLDPRLRGSEKGSNS